MEEVEEKEEEERQSLREDFTSSAKDIKSIPDLISDQRSAVDQIDLIDLIVQRIVSEYQSMPVTLRWKSVF